MNIINSYATPLFGYSLRYFLLCSYQEFIIHCDCGWGSGRVEVLFDTFYWIWNDSESKRHLHSWRFVVLLSVVLSPPVKDRIAENR